MRVERVTKVYPARVGREPVTAVQDVSFDLRRGEILGLLGPNGAGKTTTIKMIAGLLRPTSGHIYLGAYDVARSRSRAVNNLGAVLEGNRNLHWKLTAYENLVYFGALKGVPKVQLRATEMIERLGLTPHGLKRVGELSRGLQQRVAIAIALLNEPSVLLLDEPTLGLDVEAAYTFKQTVKTIAQDGCAIVLTTHQMEVAQELSSRIAIIARGKLAVSESIHQLMDAYRSPGYEVSVRGALPSPTWLRLTQLGAQPLEGLEGQTRFALPQESAGSLYAVLEVLREAHAEIVSVQQQEINLEEIYLRVVGAL